MRVVVVVLLAAPWAGAAERKPNPEIQDKVDQIFGDVSGAQSPGVAILVRKNGRTLLRRVSGVRELRTGAPLDARTNFRLASCTKQFTATAIMLLVHDGKLRYEQPLTDIFPDFPEYGKHITIRHLLNHTSGLPDYEELMDLASSGRPSPWTETRQIQDAEVLRRLTSQKRGKFAPGTQWSYSNSGYVVLGLVVAKVSGMSFGDFLRQRIFQPLKMNHTIAYVKGENQVPNRAYGHSKTGDRFAETDQSSTSATLGDGGVYSNLEDLALWDDALARHTLLSREEMQPALAAVKLADGTQPHWASGPGDSDPLGGKAVAYGFGWFLDAYRGHSRLWHYGDTTGFKTAIERFPEDKLTVIVLANRSDVDAPALALKLADLFLTARDPTLAQQRGERGAPTQLLATHVSPTAGRMWGTNALLATHVSPTAGQTLGTNASGPV